jgi:hypothetical protein
MRVEQDRADWATYSENTGKPQATLGDHFRLQQREDKDDN